MFRVPTSKVFGGLRQGTDPLYIVICSHCTLHALITLMGGVVRGMPFVLPRDCRPHLLLFPARRKSDILRDSATVLLRTAHIQIVVRQAVLWYCMHAHCTKGVVGEASKEAKNFKCSPERIKLQTFVAALPTSTTSIWALADEIIKIFALIHKFSEIFNLATCEYIKSSVY